MLVYMNIKCNSLLYNFWRSIALTLFLYRCAFGSPCSPLCCWTIIWHNSLPLETYLYLYYLFDAFVLYSWYCVHAIRDLLGIVSSDLHTTCFPSQLNEQTWRLKQNIFISLLYIPAVLRIYSGARNALGEVLSSTRLFPYLVANSGMFLTTIDCVTASEAMICISSFTNTYLTTTNSNYIRALAHTSPKLKLKRLQESLRVSAQTL